MSENLQPPPEPPEPPEPHRSKFCVRCEKLLAFSDPCVWLVLPDQSAPREFFCEPCFAEHDPIAAARIK